MRKTNFWLRPLLAALLIFAAAPFVQAQANGSIHGHAQDPLGNPIANVSVQLSLDGGATAKYTFTTDDNGDYKGTGIAPGSYTVTLLNATKQSVDRFDDVKITSSTDTAQDFDLSRPDYVAKMTPEQKKQLEEAKAKNAELNKENTQIKNLNADLTKARDDNKSGNFADADQLMTRDSQAKPDEALIWIELGKAQKGEKKFADAATSLQKAVDLDAASKKPRPDVEAAALNESLVRFSPPSTRSPTRRPRMKKQSSSTRRAPRCTTAMKPSSMDRAGDVTPLSLPPTRPSPPIPPSRCPTISRVRPSSTKPQST